MKSAATDRLLSKLNEGDAEAAAEMFQAFEPYLRMIIRRKISQSLRAKFDSTDIVQSVWADILKGLHRSNWTFQDVGQLRALLITMTRNRFVDRLRQHRRALKHELTLPPQDIETRAAIEAGRVSENILVDELWKQMLGVCPAAHHEVLHLKRQGASLDEIAAHTGLHKGSVRRILYQTAQKLARVNAAHNRR